MQSSKFSNKTHKSYKTYKTYIKSFNLASPRWEDFPMQLLHLNKTALADEECHILSAIKLEYFYEHMGETLFTKAKKTGVVISLICLISLMSLILFSINGEKISRPVSAATVERGYATVNATLKQIDIKETIYEVYESTRSAIFR